MTEQTYQKFLIGEKDGIRFYKNSDNYLLCPTCEKPLERITKHVVACREHLMFVDVSDQGKIGKTLEFFHLKILSNPSMNGEKTPVMLQPKIDVKPPNITVHVHIPEKPKTRKKIWLEKDPKTGKRIQIEEEEEIGET